MLFRSEQGVTFARFRFSSAGGLGPTGFADDGEVEDYSVVILANPWHNPSSSNDVNADGFVTAIDVLIIINDINKNSARALPIPRPAGENLTSPPLPSFAPYLDVNGDGFISAQGDVLRIITFLNNRGIAEGESLVIGSGFGEGEGESEPSPLAAGLFNNSVIVDHRLELATQEVRATENQPDAHEEFFASWAASDDSDDQSSRLTSVDPLPDERFEDLFQAIASVEHPTDLNDTFFE